MMEQIPVILITSQMIESAKSLIPSTKVNRTIASEIDTLSGNLGEFIFAQYLYNDWRQNRVGKNKGDLDFIDIEIKTSAFPFNVNLNLLVREDYAKKRKAPFYIQIIIDVENRNASEIKPNTKAYICGWATYSEVDEAPKKDMGSKLSSKGGYLSHYIGIRKLHPMKAFLEEYKKRVI